MPTIPILSQYLLKVLARVVSQGKEIKWSQAEKKDSKLFLFADDMILHLTNQTEYLDLEKGFVLVCGGWEPNLGPPQVTSL